MNDSHLTLSASLNLSDSDRYQAIFASQSYGTFYTIYSVFTFKDELLQSISFKIKNYKGQINLGFLASTGSSGHTNASEILGVEEDGSLNLMIPLRALSGIEETKFEITAEAKPIPKSDISQIFIYRMLKRMNPKRSQPASDGNIFDSEFYHRSGSRLVEKDPIFGQEGYDITTQGSSSPFSAIGLAAFGGNCETSLIKTH